MVRSEIKMIVQKTISYCLSTDSHIVFYSHIFLFLHNYLNFGIKKKCDTNHISYPLKFRLLNFKCSYLTLTENLAKIRFSISIWTCLFYFKFNALV